MEKNKKMYEIKGNNDSQLSVKLPELMKNKLQKEAFENFTSVGAIVKQIISKHYDI